MPYTPFYPGGWQNQPAITTPIVAAALQNIENALISVNAGTFNVLTYGADPTGATDSTAAIQNAINALPVTGGVVIFPAGTYKVSSTLTSTTVPTYFLGSGQDCTFINYTGSGDCLRYYSTQLYTSGWGGGVKGLTIDGTSAAAGAAGAHIGDIYQLQLDFGVRNFGGAGSKGIWFDNTHFYTEDMYGHVWAEKNTSNVVFDNSANIGGQATGSFARALLDIVLDCKGVGNGVTVQGGAVIYDHRVGIYGNMDYSSSATQWWALTITGSNAGGNSRIQAGTLNIGMECNATNANPAPGTITFGTAGSNYIRACAGVLDFGAATAFSSANNWDGSFQFDGPILGDPLLKRVVGSAEAYYDLGVIGNNAFLTTRFANLLVASPAGNVTGAILGINDEGLSGAQNANAYCTVVNDGAGSITFDVLATSHVATGTSCVIPSKQAMTFVWVSGQSNWYQVT